MKVTCTKCHSLANMGFTLSSSPSTMLPAHQQRLGLRRHLQDPLGFLIQPFWGPTAIPLHTCCTHTCVHIHMCTSGHTQICICIVLHTCIHIYRCIIPACIHICMHACMHTYTHTHTHTHTTSPGVSHSWVRVDSGNETGMFFLVVVLIFELRAFSMPDR
jgi:hypothetical protein